MRNMRQQGTSREATFFPEKWKIFDNYVLLIAEKKYKATHKQNSRFNAPSVTRANTKKSAPTHNCKNKKCPKFKIGDHGKGVHPCSLDMWKIWQQGTSREATSCRSDAFYDAVCQQWQGLLSADPLCDMSKHACPAVAAARVAQMKISR